MESLLMEENSKEVMYEKKKKTKMARIGGRLRRIYTMSSV